jgi:opacity protein-like surface antigen
MTVSDPLQRGLVNMARSNRHIFCTAAVLLMATVGAPPADAQSQPQPRIEISANVGAQTPAGKFTEARSFPSNGGETATVNVNHSLKTGLGLNVGAAVRVVPKVWIGVQYGLSDMKPGASLEAAIPHPLLFNAPRTVQGSVNDVAHKEQRVHVDLMYALPIRAVDVRVMGGPTFFTLKRDFVSDVLINETYPFDTATFASATRRRLSGSATGFNAGVDISRALTSHLSLGGIIRYSRADVKFDDSELGKHTVKAGGLETLAGVRFRF